MSKRFLMIENQGTVGADLLTIVGASSSRDVEDMIGQFGSGIKFSIALLLRHKTEMFLFTGKQGYEFGIDTRETLDVRSRGVTINEVYMKGIAGPTKARKNLGFDLDFGRMNWHSVSMAC